MEECKIINYTNEYRDLLRKYMYKIFPEYSVEYIEYCLDTSSGKVPSKLVVTENGEVVGCHLYFNTKAYVYGEEKETQWGHDTYLNKEYRSTMGLDFMLHLKTIKSFGLGMTDINTKIEKLLKKVFIGDVFNYYTINRKALFTPFQRLFKIAPRISAPEIIKVKGHEFKRVHEAEEITYPNKGYWYKDRNDIDFCRDAEFLNSRFLQNKVHEYYMYSCDIEGKTCYFVVRQCKYRGFPALTLCDFRYEISNLASLALVLKAAKKIAIKSNLGVLFFVCGDVHVNDYYKRRLHYQTPISFDTGLKIKPTDKFSITGADSDADFLKL